MDDCIRATLYHAQRSHVSESIPTPDSDGPPFGDRKPLSGAGIGASYSAQRKGVAQQVFPSGVSSGTEDRQGRHGTEAGGSHVLDVAQGVELRAVDKVRFARGTTRNRRWCAVEHRVIDWASRSPFAAEFEVVIMIESVTEEMHGSH